MVNDKEAKAPHLYAVDLDGTLLAEDKTYDHAQFDRVMDLLAEQGSYLAIATGNQMPKIQQYMAGHEHHSNLYYIAENGAIIHNQGKDLALWSFSPELVEQTLKALQAHPQFGLVISCRNGSYVPQERLEPIASLILAQIKAKGIQVPDLDESNPLSALRLFYPNAQLLTDRNQLADTVVKLALTSSGQEDAYETLAMVQEALPEGIVATSSGFGAIDLILEGHHKGHGLEWLANHLGVPGQQTTAFGDSGNDLEMFRYAGRALAMANSDPVLLDEASLQIGSHKEGAVLNFIEGELTSAG
ncbi:HAD-IIB family hydrolase [Rothia sp. CCM 9417]|uniref:HAD-IIB family hydrolase n=1 Tax=Rothia sp. CCM 9417 TaxID=3402657 RepID=UPI003AE17D95